MMNLYLIEQDQNRGYDMFDSAVVAAPDEETARNMHPRTGREINWLCELDGWCDEPEHVMVEYIGEAAEDVEQGVVCASFNAG